MAFFHPLSPSLSYFSHTSKFHSVPLKISKTQIGGEWIRLQFARRFDYLPSIPIFVSQLPRFSAIFLNFTGFGTRLECAAVSLPAFSISFFFFFPPPPLSLLVKFNATLGRFCSRYCWTRYFKLWLHARRNFHLSSFPLHEFRYTCRRFPV